MLTVTNHEFLHYIYGLKQVDRNLAVLSVVVMQAVHFKSLNACTIIESVDSISRDGTDTPYM